ncbi:titin isoform X2 [Belonocnema kinseyi]|uniref:titin isoform X2 n=1 Tax=Belonocnema kinseyi TaxID=2817044 RepID=UPI00143CDDBF|nr:titin isoform X2 [Belonocnema kinseyi]
MGGFAWVTLATNDSYSLGALVLANSLRRAGTPHDLVVLITPGVTDAMREKLSAVFSLVQEVNILDSKDEANLRLLARPELGITFTKLHCWRLTQYTKCVFVDADALVIRNCDELFERDEFSAAPDVGWPDCFNSGVFVFKPSQETYDALVEFATAKGSFDGGDQGLLNMYFSDWAQKDISKHLPFIYNMCSTATYSYLPAFKQFGEDVRIIHFIGATKPWLQYFDTLTGIVQPPSDSSHLQPLLQVWWNIFCDNVHPQLNPIMATSSLAPPWHNIMSLSQIPRINNETYSDFGLHEVDFSEFKDPWEAYSPQLDPFLKDIQQISQENPEDSESGSAFQKSGEGKTFQEPQQTQESDNHFEDHSQFRDDKNNEIRAFHHEQKEESKNFSQSETYQAEFKEQEENQTDFHPVCEHRDHESRLEESQIDHAFQPYQEEHHSSQVIQPEFEEEYSHSKESESQDQNIHSQVHQTLYTIQKSVSQSKRAPPRKILKNILPEDKTGLQKKQDLKQDRQTDKQTKLHSLRSQIPIKPPRIFPKKKASLSEQTMKHLESNYAGLAGALAKLTLGEPRSNEQMVFEEHMRKMSWEQGQIDYLGRDSFDNIWKKISSTLATGPVREKTPPQPDSAELKKGVTEALAKAEVEKTEKKIPEEVPAVGTDEISEEQKRSVASAPKTTVPVEVQQIPTALEVQKVHEQIPEPAPVTPEPVPKTPVSESVPESPVSEVVQTTPVVPEPVPEILVPEVVQPTPVVPEPVLEPPVPETVPEVVQPTPVVPEPVPEIPVVPEVVPEELKATVVPEVQQTPAVSEAQSAPVPEKIQTTPVAETAAIPEETQETPVAEPVPETPVPEHLQKEEAQEKPVPIQVAESVLHAEPKESVSQVTLPVGEEAISSIVTSAQESALAVSEALIDPATSEPATLEPTAPKFENGSVDPQTEILPSATISCTSDTSEGSTALLARSQNVVSFIPEPIEVPTEEVQPKEKTEETEVQKESEAPTETKTPEDTKAEEPKSERRTSRSFSMEKPLLPVSESKLTVQIPPRQPSEVSGSVEKPEEQTETAASSASGAEIPAESESSDSPARPIRSKEIKAPPTPTIIEATPPTSPQIEPEEEAEGDEKVAKKVVKKVVKKQSTDESEETEGESSGKKVTKKVVKKVVKKKEGEAEGSSPTEKKKVLKKTTAPKSAQLEADKSVPETPPPGSSEVPVPPKRKVKTSTTTKETTSKQPDTEL